MYNSIRYNFTCFEENTVLNCDNIRMFSKSFLSAYFVRGTVSAIGVAKVMLTWPHVRAPTVLWERQTHWQLPGRVLSTMWDQRLKHLKEGGIRRGTLEEAGEGRRERMKKGRGRRIRWENTRCVFRSTVISSALASCISAQPAERWCCNSSSPMFWSQDLPFLKIIQHLDGAID